MKKKQKNEKIISNYVTIHEVKRGFLMHEIQKNISKDKIIKQNKEIFTEDFARTFEKK